MHWIIYYQPSKERLTMKKKSIKKPTKTKTVIKKVVKASKPSKNKAVKKPVKHVNNTTKKIVKAAENLGLGFKPSFLSDLTAESKLAEAVKSPAVEQPVSTPSVGLTPWTNAAPITVTTTDPWAGCTPVLPA